MLEITSSRGGVRVPGIDDKGIDVSHCFEKAGEKKKFSEVDENVLRDGQKCGYFTYTGEPSKPKTKEEKEVEHAEYLKQKDAVTKAKEASDAARAKEAKAAEGLNFAKTDADKKKVSEEVAKLKEAADKAGRAYEEEKAKLDGLK